MKNTFLIIALFAALCLPAFGQGGLSTSVKTGSSFPSGAKQWTVFVNTSSSPYFYVCTNSPCTLAGHWVSGSAGGGGVWGAITGTLSSQTDLQTALNLKAALASPALTGTPTVPTPSTGDNSTTAVNSAFVKNQLYATLASPALTGTPTVPTPSTGDNSTTAVNSAFVKNQLYCVAFCSSIGATGAGSALGVATLAPQMLSTLGTMSAGLLNGLNKAVHMHVNGKINTVLNGSTGATVSMCFKLGAGTPVAMNPQYTFFPAAVTTPLTFDEDVSCTTTTTGASGVLSCGTRAISQSGATGIAIVDEANQTLDLTQSYAVGPCVTFTTSSTSNTASAAQANAEETE